MEISYSDVEKKKKGDVSRNASTTLMLKATRPRIVDFIVV